MTTKNCTISKILQPLCLWYERQTSSLYVFQIVYVSEYFARHLTTSSGARLLASCSFSSEHVKKSRHRHQTSSSSINSFKTRASIDCIVSFNGGQPSFSTVVLYVIRYSLNRATEKNSQSALLSTSCPSKKPLLPLPQPKYIPSSTKNPPSPRQPPSPP